MRSQPATCLLQYWVEILCVGALKFTFFKILQAGKLTLSTNPTMCIFNFGHRLCTISQILSSSCKTSKIEHFSVHLPLVLMIRNAESINRHFETSHYGCQSMSIRYNQQEKLWAAQTSRILRRTLAEYAQFPALIHRLDSAWKMRQKPKYWIDFKKHPKNSLIAC
jgi:hypothetical protein